MILAGGVGSRFWPMSTRERPKQLLPLASERPLIRDTLDRARALVPDDRIRILAGRHLVEPFRRALPDLAPSSYFVEPDARGTCPVLAWAATEIEREDPGAVMVSLHADHLIRPVEELRRTLGAAALVARDERVLVTIGAVPDRVETGFGHVQLGDRLASPEGVDVHRVGAFHEKPDAETARAYVDAGYLWNTGIFVWRADTFLEEVRAHAPEVAPHLPLLETAGPDAFFDAVTPVVVDRAVLERSGRVACARASFDWDDVGSWEALFRTRSADADGNVLHGPEVRVVEGTGNLAFAEAGRLVLFGTEDLMVIRAGDTTLVLPRARAADLKALLAALGEPT